MKKLIFPSILALAVFRAGGVTFTYDNILKDIPDNDPTGVFDSHTIAGGFGLVTDLNVSLNISGDYNGDLYATLVHENDAYAVLLNRVGRSSTSSYGYASTGFNITLDDQTAVDIHNTGFTSGALSGTYQPDARETDPANTLATDSRTAYLSNFNGIDPSGTWTLFLADLSPGGTSKLVNWQLEFNEAGGANTVPDSIPYAGSISVVGLLLFHWVEKRINTKCKL